MSKKLLLTIFISVLFSSLVKAVPEEYTLAQINYAQGLSNSAVISLYQDHQGFMWFGTYDGLNNYDSKTMSVYRTDMTANKQLLNNVIYGISCADNNCLWISTNTGINRFSLDKRCVVGSYQMFKGSFNLYSNHKGETWVLDQDGIYYYNTFLNTFKKIYRRGSKFKNDLSFVDENGRLWLFSSTDNNIYQCRAKDYNQEFPNITTIRTSIHQKQIKYTYFLNGILYFIDIDNNLFLFDISRGMKIYIRNVGDIIKKYGKIMGIIPFNDDIVIAFMQNGLIKLDATNNYAENIIDRNIRIFTVLKDPHQNIIWVATDGKGVMAYSKQHQLASHILFSDLGNRITRQVRSIFTDRYNNLWFGTKGDGLVRVRDYTNYIQNQQISIYSPGTKHPLSTYHRGLQEYQVFNIVPSKYFNGFWIGAAENFGLSYYDYKKDAVIPVSINSSLLQRIHGIYEENSNTLWTTTSGQGLCKIQLKKNKGSLEINSVRQYLFYLGKKEINDFYPMVIENDSIMWLGSRGMGLVKFNFKKRLYKVYLLGKQEEFSLNDILCIYRKQKIFYIGTVSGLVRMTFGPSGNPIISRIGKREGFLNDMIHGIVEDENGYLWLSTNKGLIKYNPKNNAFHTYYYSNGLQIGEFSDDAFSKSPYNGNIFFGGINGLLYLEKGYTKETEYHPNVFFRDLTLGVDTANFANYYNKSTNTLSIKGKPNTFSISFIAPDYLNGDNFEYSYLLEGSDEKEWSSFSSNNIASFTALPYGHYILKVRYKKDVFDTDYSCYELKIHIVAPWYSSFGAYLIYLIIILISAVYLSKVIKKFYRSEKLIKELTKHEVDNYNSNNDNEKYREEIKSLMTAYEACGKLTQFKSMPDQYYDELDSLFKSFTSLAFHLGNNWDQQFDLRKYLPSKIIIYNDTKVKDLSEKIIRSLLRNNTFKIERLTIDIEDNLTTSIADKPLGYILYYLYSRTVDAKADIHINISIADSQLMINLVTQDLSLLNFLIQEEDEKGPISTIKSFNDVIYRNLYYYALTVLNGNMALNDYKLSITLPFNQKGEQIQATKGQKEILLLEDKEEISWLITDLLGDGYSVHHVATLQEAFRYLRKNSPAIFIADTTMYLNEENKFLEYVETNKGLLLNSIFIPILTWNSAFALSKDFEKLVDALVIAPYNIIFIKKIIDAAISCKSQKKEAVIFNVSEDDKIICYTPEQTSFMKQLIDVLSHNLDKEDLNTAFIAESMNISLRQYYRRFKEISSLSSTDFIKNYRLEKAAKLLLESDMSIQDVINEVGIQSRSYFYKEFSAKYGVTPKAYKDFMINQKSKDNTKN